MSLHIGNLCNLLETYMDKCKNRYYALKINYQIKQKCIIWIRKPNNLSHNPFQNMQYVIICIKIPEKFNLLAQTHKHNLQTMNYLFYSSSAKLQLQTGLR